MEKTSEPPILQVYKNVIKSLKAGALAALFSHRKLIRHAFLAYCRRKKMMRKKGVLAPPGIGISPTDRCCIVVGGVGFHVNPQGFIEPCPFTHYAKENIKTESFEEILRSPLLSAIRKHPRILIHGAIGCSLVNNSNILDSIADKLQADQTSRKGDYLYESNSI